MGELLRSEWINLMQGGKNPIHLEKAQKIADDARNQFLNKNLTQAVQAVEKHLDLMEKSANTSTQPEGVPDKSQSPVGADSDCPNKEQPGQDGQGRKRKVIHNLTADLDCPNKELQVQDGQGRKRKIIHNLTEKN